MFTLAPLARPSKLAPDVADPSSSPTLVPSELVDFFEGGVSLLVGTCDEGCKPESTRAVGACVGADRAHLTVYLNQVNSVRTVANLAVNPRVAICFTRPIDHRTIQVKGRALKVRQTLDTEKPRLERYISAFCEALYLVGVTRAVGGRLAYWPSQAVEIEIESLFAATPGPGAGERLK
ncbi:MAG: pyridoxamine 5'-phosphate oxidase family protein [Polyangiaceae bacterium]